MDAAGEVPGRLPRMIPVRDYIRLRFAIGGRERPAVDCWGLYRLIVGELRGVWLADYEGVESGLAIARTLRREEGTWIRVATGAERPLDLVLMNGMAERGAPQHVGCVLEPGRMIDIEETTGVMVRAFRDTERFRALPTVRHRVLGVFRPESLA